MLMDTGKAGAPGGQPAGCIALLSTAVTDLVRCVVLALPFGVIRL